VIFRHETKVFLLRFLSIFWFHNQYRIGFVSQSCYENCYVLLAHITFEVNILGVKSWLNPEKYIIWMEDQSPSNDTYSKYYPMHEIFKYNSTVILNFYVFFKFKYILTVIFQIYFDRYFSNIFWPLIFLNLFSTHVLWHVCVVR